MAVEVYPVKREKDVRADERRKVIAELTSDRARMAAIDALATLRPGPPNHPDPDHQTMSWQQDADAILRAIGSLLAPEGEGEAVSPPANSPQTPAVSPSSEPARAGEWHVVQRREGEEDIPFVVAIAGRLLARVEARALNREPHDQGVTFVAREREVGPWVDVPAHEEGSTHG